MIKQLQIVGAHLCVRPIVQTPVETSNLGVSTSCASVETLQATSLQNDNHKESFLRNASCWCGTLLLPSDAYLTACNPLLHKDNHSQSDKSAVQTEKKVN
jgi:hypothetical protein